MLTILLLVATVVSFVAWWIERESPIPYEALTILAIVILNGVLGFVQESRAEQAVAALEAMTAPTARVLRDGQQRMVPAAELVPGDVLLLEEGDTIPADARVLESIALRVAESALTGESTPVSKNSAPLDGETGIADRTNMVFSGTAIAAGRGRAIVTATGPATEIGKIAGSLQATEDVATPLQRELDRIGKLLGIAVIVIAIVISVTILVVAGPAIADRARRRAAARGLAGGGRRAGGPHGDHDDRAVARDAAHGGAQRDRPQALRRSRPSARRRRSAPTRPGR